MIRMEIVPGLATRICMSFKFGHESSNMTSSRWLITSIFVEPGSYRKARAHSAVIFTLTVWLLNLKSHNPKQIHVVHKTRLLFI